MIHRWQWLTFMHWPYRADTVQRLVPTGLTVETFDGQAWVGLIPFRMRVRFPGLPHLGPPSTFPETNVRTYVTGPDGKSGIWFFSLDAGRLAPTLVARTLFSLPYVWSRMSISRSGREIEYRATRRWPDRGTRSMARIVVGDLAAPVVPGGLEDFLVSRFRLYGRGRRGLFVVPAEHPPWRLHSARPVELRDGLVEAAGLPAAHGSPLAHYAAGVEVRIGPRTRVSP
jgi:uncharacterized protein YqjF (DUF2071 family)